MSKYLLILAVPFLLASCAKKVIPPEDIELGLAYFPLEEGHFVEYEVDSIIYDDFNLQIDTTSLKFRDEVDRSILDNEGRESWVVNRLKRYNDNDPWVADHTYYVTKDNFKIEVQEQNLRFIKMVFPTKINTRWYGNSYVSSLTNPEFRWLDDWQYEYTDIEQSFNTGHKNFKNTNSILQQDYIEGQPSDPNAFSAYTYGKEVYAKNVGMVFKELTRWEYQPSQVQFRKGFTLILRAKRHN